MMTHQFLLVAIFGLVLAAGSNVKILTKENFDETINNNEHVIVEFFAPWCGHCKSLAPHFEKAATTLASEGIILASVDATVQSALAERYGVKGYPTLKVFNDGAVSDYAGGRTEDTIVSYARKIFGPPAAELTTLETAKADKVSVVGFFAATSGAAYEAFIAQASSDQDTLYYFTTSAALATEAGVTQPAIKVFKQFDEGVALFTGEFTKEAIGTFVSAERMPLVIPFSMDSVQDIFGSKLGKVVFLFRSTSDAARLDPQFAAVAAEHKGVAVFVTADYSESRLNQHLGVDSNNGASFLLAETPQGGSIRRFPLAGEVTQATMDALLDSYEAGTLQPTLKSDPIPASNSGNVKVVVGKSFNDIVMDESKDVLLEVYAPWCGHCKKLEPIWEELATSYAKDSSLVIAKMDGTSNEVDGVNVQGFPTLLFYPAGQKTAAGQPYSGGRELKDLKSFIKANHHAGHGHAHGAAHSHHGHEEL